MLLYENNTLKDFGRIKLMKRTMHYIYQWLSIFSSFPQQQFPKRFPLTATLVIIMLTLFSVPLHAQEIINHKSGKLQITHTALTLPAGSVNLEIKRTLHQNKSGIPGLLETRWRKSWTRS